MHCPTPLALLTAIAIAPPITAQHTWVQRTTGPVQTGARLATDPVRGRVLRFGGVDAVGRPVARTEAWSGADWVRLVPPTEPAARAAHALSDDPLRGRVVLFGGTAEIGTWPATTAFGDTWEWDGRTWTVVATGGPSPRAGAAMAFDRARRRHVLFGGGDDSTWEWDGAGWSVLNTAVRPPVRQGAAMAYDAARARIVLHGGFTGGRPGVGPLADTWEFDGASWTLRSSAGPGEGEMAYDAQRQRCVLVTRATATTWDWDGSAWTARGPAYQGGGALAWDPLGTVVITDGGPRIAAWGGSSWREFGVDRELPQTVGAALAEHRGSGHVLFFGGWFFSASGQARPDGQTLLWDGLRWTAPNLAVAPPARGDHAMVYSTRSGRVLMFGGRGASVAHADTWEWDGRSWRQRPLAVSPPGGDGHRMAFDERRGAAVLVTGGTRAGETWEYRADRWQQVVTATTPPGAGGVAYDARNRVVVLFDGGVLGAGTWAYDGVDWRRRTPTTAPPTSGPMAFVPSLNGVALFEPAGTWLWNGIDWRRTVVTGGPAPFSGAAAYHTAREAAVLVDGGYDNATWLLSPNPAASVVTGTGCGGVGRAPWLESYGRPVLANTKFALDLGDAPPSSAAAVLLGAPGSAPLGSGCTLFADPLQPILVLPLVTSALGAGTIPLPIPERRFFAGGVAAAQATVLHASGPLAGLSFTHGVLLTLGE